MPLQRGDPVFVDEIFGLIKQLEGSSVLLYIFKAEGRELTLTDAVTRFEANCEPFQLLKRRAANKFWCKTVLKNGSKVNVKWDDPVDLVDALESRESPSLDDTPSRRKSTRLSGRRSIAMEPVTLFADSDSSVYEHESENESELSRESDDDEPPVPAKRAASQPSTPRKPKASKLSPRKTATPRKPRDSPKGTPRKAAREVSQVTRKVPVTPKKRRHASGFESSAQRSLPTTPHKERPQTPKDSARNALHISQIPDTLPCRDDQFSKLFMALEHAVKTETGTCIYISGVPGSGKTSTVREVIEQLYLRQEDGEVPEFDFMEINGLRLAHPDFAYDQLYDHIFRTEKVATKQAMTALETRFNTKSNGMKPLIVLMDELDQLVTKDQGVIYNFFNWPSLAHSRLIVVAVANTFDLPERMLQNKIKSRLGLTRIQFPGYTHAELQQILNSRLEHSMLIQQDAIEYIGRKVGNVSGDARRALDICRRAIALVDEGDMVTIDHVHQAFSESQSSPFGTILASLSMGSKLCFLALCQSAKRSKTEAFPLNQITQEVRELFQNMVGLEKYEHIFYSAGRLRFQGYQQAIAELVEIGIITQDLATSYATGKIRFNVDMDAAREAVLTGDLATIFNKT